MSLLQSQVVTFTVVLGKFSPVAVKVPAKGDEDLLGVQAVPGGGGDQQPPVFETRSHSHLR